MLLQLIGRGFGSACSHITIGSAGYVVDPRFALGPMKIYHLLLLSMASIMFLPRRVILIRIWRIFVAGVLLCSSLFVLISMRAMEPHRKAHIIDERRYE